jgi:hypothetical protein
MVEPEVHGPAFDVVLFGRLATGAILDPGTHDAD